MNERSWILTGKLFRGLWFFRRNRQREGLPCSVDFDWEWAMRQEEQNHNVAFLHSHPCQAYPSSRDERTMRAFCLCFGRPILCAILGTDGLRGFWFIDDESPFVERKLVQLPFGIILAKDFQRERPRGHRILGEHRF